MPKRVCRASFLSPLPPNSKLVAKPSRWANPFAPKHPKGMTQAERVDSVEKYRKYVLGKLKVDPHWLDELRGFDLVCYCKLTETCHADVLLELANR